METVNVIACSRKSRSIWQKARHSFSDSRLIKQIGQHGSRNTLGIEIEQFGIHMEAGSTRDSTVDYPWALQQFYNRSKPVRSGPDKPEAVLLWIDCGIAYSGYEIARSRQWRRGPPARQRIVIHHKSGVSAV